MHGCTWWFCPACSPLGVASYHVTRAHSHTHTAHTTHTAQAAAVTPWLVDALCGSYLDRSIKIAARKVASYERLATNLVILHQFDILKKGLHARLHALGMPLQQIFEDNMLDETLSDTVRLVSCSNTALLLAPALAIRACSSPWPAPATRTDTRHRPAPVLPTGPSDALHVQPPHGPGG